MSGESSGHFGTMTCGDIGFSNVFAQVPDCITDATHEPNVNDKTVCDGTPRLRDLPLWEKITLNDDVCMNVPPGACSCDFQHPAATGNPIFPKRLMTKLTKRINQPTTLVRRIIFAFQR